MPITPVLPIEVKHEVVTADTVKINGVYIDIPVEGGSPVVAVGISYGSKQPDGSISYVEHKRITIGDPADLSKVMSTVTSGKTLYEEIKATVYNYLMDAGIVPADSVVS